MNLSKINPWIAGLALIFTGTILIYLESYRNNETIDIVAYLMIFLGWITLFIKATKGTSIDAEKIFFKDNKVGWLKQRFSNFLFYITLTALVFGNIYLAINMAHARKRDLLANGPTKTAVAEVAYIQVRKGRSTTSYYAVFQFTVNGNIIDHPWYEEHESDFLVGEKYKVKYAVEHPEMFSIVEKLP